MFSRKYIWRLCPFSSYVSWSRSLVHMIWCFFCGVQVCLKKKKKLSRPFVDMSCASAACSHWWFGHPCPCLAWEISKLVGLHPSNRIGGMVLKNGNKPSPTYINYKQTERVETILLYYKQLQYIYILYIVILLQNINNVRHDQLQTCCILLHTVTTYLINQYLKQHGCAFANSFFDFLNKHLKDNNNLIQCSDQFKA